jgi:Beta-lactamase class C and other penicillin binding proteins
MPYLSGDFRVPDAGPRRNDLTLKHLLTMTSGIKWDESTVAYTDPANSCAGMEKSDDWIQFVLDQPLADAPGATFVYNSGVTELLSQVIKKVTGKQADEYAAEHLFAPLGITDTYWKRTPKGLSDTEGGLYLTARDLAKIGYLYLHDGVWDGRRLLPEGGSRRRRRRWSTRGRGSHGHASTATSGGCSRTATARGRPTPRSATADNA